jgi:Txe/YoeB family toxin of Txe-Axe toxin-antitoxin module
LKFDLNDAGFQKDLLALEKAELLAFFKTLRKLQQLSWQEIYDDNGLKWESLKSSDSPLYTIRITQKCRAIVKRRDDQISFVSIHPDHDSAYE